jgi:hypothetical protein
MVDNEFLIMALFACARFDPVMKVVQEQYRWFLSGNLT